MDATQQEARRVALVKIHQALDCDSYGPMRTWLLHRSAEEFRKAGMEDYAVRAERAASAINDHEELMIQQELS